MIIPYTQDFTPKRPQRTPTPEEHQFLTELCAHDVLPAAQALVRLGREALTRLVQENRVWLIRSPLGPLIKVGWPGPTYQVLSRHTIDASTENLYRSLAITHAEQQGYRLIRPLGRSGARLADHLGHEHYLHASIVRGDPSPGLVAELLKDWRSDLVITAGTFILVTASPQRYARLARSWPRLTLWSLPGVLAPPAAHLHGLRC